MRKLQGRLQSDYRKIMGRRQEDDWKSTVRFRSGSSRNDGPFREASAKPARLREATAVQLPCSGSGSQSLSSPPFV